MTRSGSRLAVDVGGTFTDIALEGPSGIITTKTPTTPGDPAEAVITGIRLTLERAALLASQVSTVIHGTTLATNALIERKGARVGAVTTKGFRDVLEIAYERRYDQYDIFVDKPDMLAPRERCYTVAERIGADGEVLSALDEAGVEALAEALARDGVESLAIGLLHSYANDTHEQRLREVLQRLLPDLWISLSSEVSPEIREYDRLSTTLANAYIEPMMAGYLKNLEARLQAEGLACPLFIMTSGGGMTTLDTAVRFPIRLVESGPSGGAILAAAIARSCGLDQVVSFDMGGTTAKVCLIDDGAPQSSRHFEIARASRFIKGSGLPVRIPVTEMIEIGAGGGSIATVDSLGRIAVGPESAGAEPGPACYRRGGTRATVTDADAALGYLDPEAFAEGRLPLDLARAERAVAQDVAEALTLAADAGADGISQIVDENMANAARVHAVERGKDLAQRTMIAFGGNGPLHAVRVAEKTGVSRIIVPPDPGVGSAIGFLNAPVSYEIVRSHYTLFDRFDFEGVNALLVDMEREARQIVSPSAAGQALTVRRIGFMRYRGQGHEIEVSLPEGPIGEPALEGLRADYERVYARLFSRVVPGMRIEVMNWAVVVATEAQPSTPIPHCPETRAASASGHRSLYFGRLGGRCDVPCYQREGLEPGDGLEGPALIVEAQTTSYVAPGFDAAIDGAGNIVMTRRPAQGDWAMAQVDKGASIERQVMWNRLLAVVEEQAQTLMRAGFSAIVRESGDISAGIFDLEGRMLAQAVTGTPGHINTMAEACRHLTTVFPTAGMRPGDVYATNDPWLAAGHLNDLLLVAPVFHRDRPVALVSCTSHLYDVGGRGMGPDGNDVFEEGVRIPPCRLVEEGRVNRLLIDIIKANSRTPVANEGDLYALIACCDVGGQRLSAMMEEFALAELDGLAGYILERSRDGVVAAIRTIPRGVYEQHMRLDGYDFELEIRARMTVGEDRIDVDFAGSSPCSRYAINVPLNYATAYSVFGIRCIVGPEIPNNAGSLAPFGVTAPAGSILNPQDPAPVAMRHVIGQILPDVVLGCLHQALPGRIPAEGASCMWDIPLRSVPITVHGGNATAFAVEATHNGGTGARPGKDGLSATAYPSGVWGSQVEITESTQPLRILRRELRPDSGGPGQYRGGLGQVIEVENREGAAMLLLAAYERTRYPARGRAGGADGACGLLSLGSGKAVAPKGVQEIPPGERLIVEMPGGGGYGDPFLRDPERVAADVRRGLVSHTAAARDYGVVVDKAGTLDIEATRRRRGESSKDERTT